MARCTVALVARSVSVDPFTNSVSAIDIAETLSIEAPEQPPWSPDAPVLVSPFDWVFLAMLQRDDPAVPEDLTGRLAVVSPQGHEFPGPDQRVDLVSAANARNFTKMPALPYSGNGVYRFLFQLRRDSAWVTASEFPLRITINVRSAAAG